MIGRVSHGDENELDRQAAAWCVRLHSDGATERDFQAFEAWLDNPGARVAYDAAEQVWSDIDENRGLVAAALAVQDRQPVLARVFSAPRRQWAIRGMALACAAALAFFVFPHPSESWIEYSAPKGVTRTVTLADGTKIRLNTGSTVKVNVTEHARRLMMAEGEASFDIVHDPQRPFVVDVDKRRVSVLGTEFNIRNYEGQMTLTVRRGIVEFQAQDQAAASWRVASGYELTHKNGDAPHLQTVDPNAAFSWQAGLLTYQDAALGEIVADLNRYFQRPISIESADVAQLRFTGVLALGQEAQVVGTLEKYFPVEAVSRDDAIILRAAARP